MRKVEAPTPVEHKDKFRDSYETHPAFGVVGISNVHSTEGHVIRMIRQEITANIPFIVQSASEHVEANKERALTDIHSHLSRSLAAVDAAVALELGREALIAAGHTAARSFIDVVDVEEGHQS